MALIFHLIEVANGSVEEKHIGYEATLKAVSWCTYLETHARRVYGMATDITHQAAAKLAKKIQEGRMQSGALFYSRCFVIVGDSWTIKESVKRVHSVFIGNIN